MIPSRLIGNFSGDFTFSGNILSIDDTLLTPTWANIQSKPSSFAPSAHQLDSATYHTVSGLTTGHFLKATGAATFAFGAHGLTNTDVGAAATSHTHGAADVASGTLLHERGGLEADVSAYSGLVKISGGATSSIADSSANWDTAYTHSQNNNQAHTDYLKNDADDISTGDLTLEGGYLTLGKNGVGGTLGAIYLRDGLNPGTTIGLTYAKWNDLETTNGIVKCNGAGDYSAVTDNSANWDTAYTHSQNNSQAHSDYLINNGDDTTSGTITAAGFIGALEGKSIDVVQLSNLNIADNDTDSLVFDFVPSKIVIGYSYKGYSTSNAMRGLTVGHTVITITGTDTFTSNLNCTSMVGEQGSTTHLYNPATQNDTTNVIYGFSGYDGSQTYLVGTATWTTSTKTLTITYQETGTTTAQNFIELIAVAYR